MERFPQYLSSPMQVLWWESDEVAIILTLLAMALVFGGIFWIVMFAGSGLYSGVKKKYPKGFLKHMIYFSGMKDLKHYPSAFQSKFSE